MMDEKLATPDAPAKKGGFRSFLVAIGLLVFLSVCALLGWLVAVTVGFRMWANWLADRVDGSMLNGTLWGLSLGFVCSLVPLIIARQALRGFRFPVRLAILAVAALVALPNIATLSIRFGSGKGAHAGQRIFDVDVPNILLGTYTGIGIGVACFLLLTVWGLMRWNDKRKTRKLSRKLAEMAGDASDGTA